MRLFKEALTSGDFLVTAELVPPKGTDLRRVASLVKDLKGVVHGIGVADNPGSSMAISPWAVCCFVTENGAEPIMHVSCRDRNRMALQSDLLGAASLKIKNILCVSGDHVSFGDHPDAMPVHDIDSVQLLETVRGLMSGKDMEGQALSGSPEFCVGAVVNPESDPLAPQFLKFKKKLRAGVDFFLTHPVFHPDKLIPLMNELKGKNAKLLAGVRLLAPEEVSRYRGGGIPGLFVPEELIAEIQDAQPGKCVEIAARFVKQLKDKQLCDGVHIMAPGQEEKIIDILRAAGI